jgi:hypothetical protein
MRTWHCWALAIAITLVSAVWQRVSGPTYPARGEVTLEEQKISFSLPRTQISGKELKVAIPVADPVVTGEVAWRRFPSEDARTRVSMSREGESLVALLPTQPMAGKVEYQVRLFNGKEGTPLFPRPPAVARFRREVPAWVLIPHVLAMFTGMLLATRAGLEAVLRRPNVRRQALWAFGLLLAGGFVLGPLVQKLAFDAWWTGAPFGWDLTDNKTLIALPAWLWAIWATRGGRPGRGSVIAATLLTLLVFAIPHSVWGSQLDWAKMKNAPVESRKLQ